MAVTPSQRPTREWPLLVLTIAIVGAICFPLWQWFSVDNEGMFSNWDAARWGKLLLGPEQIVCYCCFTWAGLILLSHYWEVLRQRRAFKLPILPTEDGTRILHEDARPLQRRSEQLMREKGPFILGNMIRLALGKYAVSRSSKDVAEIVRVQGEVDQGRMVSSMATVQYLAWAIPAIGFLGTVRGLAGSLTSAGAQGEDALSTMLSSATANLNVAFDTTFIALVLSLVVMFFLHAVQRDEESLVIDCQQYCVEHLINRLYEPESLGEGNSPALFTSQDFAKRPAMSGRGAR